MRRIAEMGHRRTWLTAVAVLALTLAMAYQLGLFSGKRVGPSSEVPGDPEGPAPQNTFEVERAPVPLHFRAVGTVTAREESRISARIRGRVASVLVRPGDAVERGDILVRLEERTTDARVEQARSTLEAARARRVRARQEFDRTENFFSRDAATERSLEQARAALDTAKAAENRAMQALEEVETVRKRTVIRSRVSGRVVQRNVDPGDLAIPGRPLIVLRTRGALWLRGAVRESLAGSVRLGQTLSVEIPAIDLRSRGTVEEIVPAVNPNSRTFGIKVALPDLDALVPGMYGRIKVPTGEDMALWVPETAVFRVGQLELVRAQTDDGGWQPRYVKIGRTWDQRVEVLSGLDEGDRVALRGRPAAEDS